MLCCAKSLQSCPTLCNPMDCSPLGSSVHGILQARILEWVAISFSRGSSWSRDQTCISCIDRWVLYHWATREAHFTYSSVYMSILIFQFISVTQFRWKKMFIYLVALGLGCCTQALSSWCVGSVVEAHGLSCSVACGILLLRPGIEPMSPALQGRFSTSGPPESPCNSI